MDNNEFKRRELARRAHRSLTGEEKKAAIREENRKVEEYAKQRRCLFPGRYEDDGPTTPPIDPSGHLSAKSKGKQKERMENSSSSMSGGLLFSRQDEADLSQYLSAPSTVVVSHSSSRPSPVSSTSSPPSNTTKNRRGSLMKSRSQLEKEQAMKICTEPYRLSAIPPWYMVDRASAAYAIPVPNLKNVMERGVAHWESIYS